MGDRTGGTIHPRLQIKQTKNKMADFTESKISLASVMFTAALKNNSETALGVTEGLVLFASALTETSGRWFMCVG